MNKKGEIYIADEPDRPMTDIFEFAEEEVADQALNAGAVKPWKGAVKEPEDHLPVDKSQPDETYTLDYVYGYRCADSRQNAYYNPDGNIVYMTASLGIILDKANNTQTFFGGGEVGNDSKQEAND